jgi:hypothetical protein
MIRMFVYLVFFGLLAVIFLNIFDIKLGKWYVNIHLKDYIVEGLKGKLVQEEDNDKTMKRRAIDSEPKRKDIYNQSRGDSSNSTKDLINVDPDVGKVRNEKSGNITDKKAERKYLEADSKDLEIDPVEKVIEKSFQTKESKR